VNAEEELRSLATQRLTLRAGVRYIRTSILA